MAGLFSKPPHVSTTARFASLEWVVNAYAPAFGGLLLLGGRSGDLLGRRRVFIAGILLFSLASLAGGLAAGQAWLLAARAIQGAGAAFAAPTALLIAQELDYDQPDDADIPGKASDSTRRLLCRTPSAMTSSHGDAT
jgi:MFS family permease